MATIEAIARKNEQRMEQILEELRSINAVLSAAFPAAVASVTGEEDSDETDLDSMTVVELKALADQHGIEYTAKSTKAELVALLKTLVNHPLAG